MPYNGVGVFQRVYQWVNDASNSIFVDATRTDTDSNDIADGLTNCITRDGQSPALANLPMNSFKFTGLGPGQNPGDSVNFLQAFTAPTFTGGATVAGGLGVTGGLTATGAINFLNATSLTGPTPSLTDNGNTIPTTAWVVQKQFGTALPAQTGNAGKTITTDGTNALWDWAQKVVRSARTASAALVQTDRGTLIDVTANTFTQTFAAAATLGSGWYCWLRNAGTGDITLDPNGAELIDGLASYVMYPGEVRLVQCDGTQFNSIVVRPFSKTFIASGTFVKPPGYSQFGGMLWGAGGSGIKSSAGTNFSGGSGGGCSLFTFPSSALGTTETVTIGAGGAAATVDGAGGNPGGNSTLGALLTAGGGNPGASGNVAGGFAYGSSTNQAISNGSLGSVTMVAQGYLAGGLAQSGSPGGSSVYGGGAGGSMNANIAAAAGPSVFGGSGGAASTSTSAASGNAPGGGGGSTATGTASGAGARGELRIWGQV